MSLSNNKDALFGSKSKPMTKSTPTPALSPAPAPGPAPGPAPAPAPASKTAGITLKSSNTGIPGVSLETKRKKIHEAQEYSAKGMAALKTSLFQWTPDHLSAAGYFERSSDLYKQAEDLNNAALMLARAAESHEASGATASAALCKIKSSEIAKEQGNKELSKKMLAEAAECWGIYGDLVKYGETLAKLAKEEEETSPKRAIELYLRSLERLCPSDTPPEQLNKAHPSTLETARTAFTFFVKSKNYKEALSLARRMVQLFSAFELESAANKALLSITALQLTLGDAVVAQQTYLQEHLNIASYLRSKECEMADLLVLAFTNRDLDQLDKAKMHSHLPYLDRELQNLIRDLDIFAEGEATVTASIATAAGARKDGAATKDALFRSSAPAAGKASTDSCRADIPLPAPADELRAQEERPAVPPQSLLDELDALAIEELDAEPETLASKPSQAARPPSPEQPQEKPPVEEEEDEIDLS